MERRRFLQLFSGALVTSATMAEADLISDFMKWLKKGPTAYSFPDRELYHDFRKNIVYSTFYPYVIRYDRTIGGDSTVVIEPAGS